MSETDWIIRVNINRDTEKKYKAANPILGYGEPCCVYTKRGTKWKIGDGVTPFKRLKYVTRIKDIESFMLCLKLEDLVTIETIDGREEVVRHMVIELNPPLKEVEAYENS